jgi:transposase
MKLIIIIIDAIINIRIIIMPLAGTIKLSPEILQSFCQALLLGVPRVVACRVAGIKDETANGWYKVGKFTLEGITPKQIAANATTHPEHAVIRYNEDTIASCQEFYLAVTKAEAMAVANWLKKIEDASEKDWKAAAWKLERLYPEIFSKQLKVKQDITSNGEAISNLVSAALTKVYGNTEGTNKVIDAGTELRLSEKSTD